FRGGGRNMAMHSLGHFDGEKVVLAQPAPVELTAGTLVEVLIPDTPLVVIDTTERERLVREYVEFMKQRWEQPLPPGFEPKGRQRKRENCYEERYKRRRK